MAAQFAKRGLVLCTVVLLLVLLCGPAMRTTEAMRVELVNNMAQDVSVTCTHGGITVPGVVVPGTAYMFEVTGSDYTGVRYTCGFQTAGKARAIVEVFRGTGGLGNEPCHCVGSVCVWSIRDIGFGCTDAYRHGWN